MDLKEVSLNNPYRHPWEISRASNIIGLLNKNEMSGAIVADVGSGDLYFSKFLSRFEPEILYAVDIEYENEIEDERIVKYQSIESIEDNSINFLFLLDVLEHTEDDLIFMKKIYSKLSRQSKVILTVPAHPCLHSEHDIFLGHKRRYSIESLRAVAEKCNFIIDYMFYFYTSLFVIRMIQKIFKLKVAHEGIGQWKLSERHILTRAAKELLDIDFSVCKNLSKIGIYIPGLSICTICRKLP
jgi:hypothetical protein